MKKLYTTLLAAAALAAPAAATAETLTIFPEATGTSTYLPINIYYCSNNIHTQMIYPASELEALSGKVIEKITFTITRAGAQTWTSPAVTVKLGATEQSEYAAAQYIADGLTEVATLTDISLATTIQVPYTWEIALDAPYTYTCGNLVVDFTNVKGNGPRNWTFMGANQETATSLSMTGAARMEKFLPTMTVEYTDAASASATLSTSEVRFPLVFTDDETTATVRLTNTGTETLSGTAAIDGDAFAVTPAAIDALAAGESADFTVRFDSDQPGDHTGTLTFAIDGLDPMAVNLAATAVSGPTATRAIFNEPSYAQYMPEGWNAYAAEHIASTGEFSEGTTEYADFGTTLTFTSANVEGFDALVWDHANAMPYTDLYLRYYYLVSPMAGGEFVFGATLTDVEATGAYVKCFEATYDADRHIFDIGREIDLMWDTPLAKGTWSEATGLAAPSTQVAFMLKYAALNYYAADAEMSGISLPAAGASASDTPAEYYTPQGVRVATPGPGLYIRRQGDTVTKVLTR